jgi:hypothetical protein
MKLYGYFDAERLVELTEVSFVADSLELRKLAHFFITQAEEFEAGSERDHMHFSDFIERKDVRNDVIVCNPKYISE